MQRDGELSFLILAKSLCLIPTCVRLAADRYHAKRLAVGTVNEAGLILAALILPLEQTIIEAIRAIAQPGVRKFC